MHSPSDLPEKAWLTRGQMGELGIELDAEHARQLDETPSYRVQPYFSASLVEELVEALEFYAKQKGLGAVLASDGGKRARDALSKAQSSLGVKG